MGRFKNNKCKKKWGKSKFVEKESVCFLTGRLECDAPENFKYKCLKWLDRVKKYITWDVVTGEMVTCFFGKITESYLSHPIGRFARQNFTDEELACKFSIIDDFTLSVHMISTQINESYVRRDNLEYNRHRNAIDGFMSQRGRHTIDEDIWATLWVKQNNEDFKHNTIRSKLKKERKLMISILEQEIKKHYL
jgi:hypothetical protein